MAKRVSLTEIEITVLLSLIDNCSAPTTWREHTLFSVDAFNKLRAKLDTKSEE